MKRYIFFVSLAVLLFQPSGAGLHAGWVPNGTAINTNPYDQTDIDMVPDGEGGAVIVWADFKNIGGYLYRDIYAQRLDRKGNALWTPGGIAICSADYEQYHARIVPDDTGGFIVAWNDSRSGSYAEIYAQKIDLAGDCLWTVNGVAVCAESNNQVYPEILTADGGGAIIAWLDYRSDPSGDIYCQRIDSDGSPLWTSTGVGVCVTSGIQEQVRIAKNGYGGFIAVWQDYRSSTLDIYSQEVTSSGSPNWGTAGSGLCTASGDQSMPQIVECDYPGSAYVIWIDTRNGNADIYGTFYQGGYSGWGTNGISICTASGLQNYPVLHKYGAYSMIAAWRDFRGGSNYDLYAQYCDYNGNMRWGTNGKSIYTGLYDQYVADIVDSDDGTLIFTWMDSRNMELDIYVQKVDKYGDPLWDPEGVALCDAYYYQTWPHMAPDGIGGAIVAWEDQRDWQSTGSDIYAGRIDCAGYWGYPSPELTSLEDVPHDQGGSLVLTWNAGILDAYPWQVITHYSIWRSLTGSQTAALLSRGVRETGLETITPDFEGSAYRFLQLGAATYGWEWLANTEAHRLETYSYTAHTLFDSTGSDDGMHYFFVASHTEDPFVYWDSAPDSGYSVDNISPAMPLGFVGEQQYSPEGLQLTWRPNSEIDMFGYNVYRGASGDFVPGDGNLVASTPDTMAFDGGWTWDQGYYYKLAAVDIHGNESPFTLLTPSQITGEDTPPAPLACFMKQNFPNPFNPSTTISFGLSESGHVSLRIYDASGRLVRALIDRHFEAGSYNISWDGRDEGGAAMASGVYFYGIETGAFRETRKMVLLR